MWTLIWIVLSGLIGVAASGCAAGSPTSVDPPEPLPTSTAPALVVMAPTIIRAPLEARLGDLGTVTLISHSDEPLYVRLRWSWGGQYEYEEGATVQAHATITRHPECFFGGAYKVKLVGRGIVLKKNYRKTQACCYSPGKPGCRP